MSEEDKARLCGKILVVDDEVNARHALATLLSDDGHEVREASDGYKALGVMQQWEPQILLTDLRMPLMDGITLLRKARELRPDLIVIVMTAFASVDTAVEAMKAGADDYLTKPLNFDAVDIILQRSLERLSMRHEIGELRAQLNRTGIAQTMLGNSAPVQALLQRIDQVAPSRATVLITGESGTGKELVARRLHDKSPRRLKPFVALHCSALPTSLLESELFGHEKGSFTGAAGMRRGRFEEANGGTLFLDEIGEISPEIQVKLLRVLQERRLERVGGNASIDVDVRIVCATNRDLKEEVRLGRFREDLYYRLDVIHIETPPLRTRKTDLKLLVQHFVARHARENNKTIDQVSPEAMEFIEAHRWPGNVRELENAIEHAVVLSEGHIIEPRHLPPSITGDINDEALPKMGIHMPGSTLDEIELYAILRSYEATGGNSLQTAQMLSISQRKVQYRLRDLRERGLL
jgi:DNA-binding NtrC family response regulator